MSTSDDETWLDAHRVDPATLTDEPLVSLPHIETELRSLVARLTEPERAARLGATVPTAILLHGPTGSGKTHTARILARRLGSVPVYESGADELTPERAHRVFALLRARHPRCVLVIDEIDLVAGERHRAGSDERAVLAALLTELDGLRPAGGVLLVAATSAWLDELDPAIRRAGRAGMTLEIGLPDDAGRRALLGHFLATRPLADDVDLEALAAETLGSTPADLRQLCVDAAGLALADDADAIGQAHLLRAIGRGGVVAPPPPPREPVDPVALHRVAVHVAGQTIAVALLLGVPWLEDAEISGTRGAVGWCPPDGRGTRMTEQELHAGVVVALAGTAAERLLLGGAVPAPADARRAVRLARELVEAGLDPTVPPVDLDSPSVTATALLDRAVGAMAARLMAARERAHLVLAAHLGTVLALADWLETAVHDARAADPEVEGARIAGADLRERLAGLGGDPRPGAQGVADPLAGTPTGSGGRLH
jgi:ATP-dependent Zn protease